jgi:solute carrier family 35 protein F5
VHCFIAECGSSFKFSFFGVILVSLSDSSHKKDGTVNVTMLDMNDAPTVPKPLLGDALALLSALFYALYVILLKVSK